jgi:hypothetical protein
VWSGPTGRKEEGERRERKEFTNLDFIPRASNSSTSLTFSLLSLTQMDSRLIRQMNIFHFLPLSFTHTEELTHSYTYSTSLTLQ